MTFQVIFCLVVFQGFREPRGSRADSELGQKYTDVCVYFHTVLKSALGAVFSKLSCVLFGGGCVFLPAAALLLRVQVIIELMTQPEQTCRKQRVVVQDLHSSLRMRVQSSGGS